MMHTAMGIDDGQGLQWDGGEWGPTKGTSQWEFTSFSHHGCIVYISPINIQIKSLLTDPFHEPQLLQGHHKLALERYIDYFSLWRLQCPKYVQ